LGGATRPLPGDGDVEKLQGDQQTSQTLIPGPKVNGAPERLRCRTVEKKDAESIRGSCKKYSLSTLSCIIDRRIKVAVLPYCCRFAVGW